MLNYYIGTHNKSVEIYTKNKHIIIKPPTPTQNLKHISYIFDVLIVKEIKYFSLFT